MRFRSKRQYIRGTAVRFSDIGTFALALPASHDSVRDQVRRVHGNRVGKHRGEDGFVTADGTFLNARQALVVARQARQLRRGSILGSYLKPEHLLKSDADSLPGGGDPASEAGASSSWQAIHVAISRTAPPHATKTLASPQQLQREVAKATAVGVLMTLLLTGAISYLASPVLLASWGRLVSGGARWHLALLTIGFNIAAGIAFGLVLQAKGARHRRSAVIAFLIALGFGFLWAASTRSPSADAGTWFFALWMLTTVAALALFAAVRVRAAVLLSFQVPWLVIAALSVA